MAKAGSKGVARPERERQILGLAIEEFGRRGYARASVADIASRAGISKPLIYGYFGSKDGLAAACADHVGRLLVDEVTAAQTPAAPGGRALDTLSAIFTVLADCPQAWSVLYDVTLPAVGEVHATARRHRAQLARLGAAGTAEVLSGAGDHDPLDHDLLGAIWQYTVTAVVRWWLDHPDQPPAAMVERCARILAAIGTIP
ncbi:TetR/AcrR family transcriptional regulator [Spirillospora sp. CA-294931]|uniref:TetR/AcrR family transcriptional regulator n=1 Tax=Spirillospora sp. CA-294931 TaxID=3240042 RepID=UPI003D925B52